MSRSLTFRSLRSSLLITMAAALVGCTGSLSNEPSGDGQSTGNPVTGCESAKDWTSGATHALGDVVVYQGSLYECIIPHTSYSDWLPSILPTLWRPVGSCPGTGGNPPPIDPNDPPPTDPNDPPPTDPNDPPPTDPGGGGTDDPLGEPTFSADFTNNGGEWSELRHAPGASLEFGHGSTGADDNAVAQLVLPGNPGAGPADFAGPGSATEIDTHQAFGFGTYRTRVKLASCEPSEDAVNGIFTYYNDGRDHNGNGLVDNSEIDIEVLCAKPSYLWLTIWTDYDTQSGQFRKFSRAVDVATGDYFESPSDHEYGIVPVGNAPEFKHPGFPAADTFYEMGFDWESDHIRYFIVLDGKEITLWDYANRPLIPQLEGPFLFNIWHPAEHWHTNGAADYPSHDATLQIDWFKHWAAR